MAVEVCSGADCSHPRARGLILCDCCQDVDAEACVRQVARPFRKLREAVTAVLEQCFCEERSCETCQVLDTGLNS